MTPASGSNTTDLEGVLNVTDLEGVLNVTDLEGVLNATDPKLVLNVTDLEGVLNETNSHLRGSNRSSAQRAPKSNAYISPGALILGVIAACLLRLAFKYVGC